MIFSKQYTTTWHDTNANRVVRPSALLVYMQETSNHHMSACGMSLDELRDTHGLAFILSKIRLQILNPLHAYEDITVQTWTNPYHGLSIPRSYRILRGDDVIAVADTTWALLDIRDRTFVKGEDCPVFNFEHESPVPCDIPARFKLPRGAEPCKQGERKIVWSDLDYNMHMNNTRYPDMLCDFLPAERLADIRGFLLSYVNEAAFGQTLDVLCTEQDGMFFFRTKNGDGKVCLEAQVVT